MRSRCQGRNLLGKRQRLLQGRLLDFPGHDHCCCGIQSKSADSLLNVLVIATADQGPVYKCTCLVQALEHISNAEGWTMLKTVLLYPMYVPTLVCCWAQQQASCTLLQQHNSCRVLKLTVTCAGHTLWYLPQKVQGLLR